MELAISVMSMAWYHDTLYVTPAGPADGQDVNGVARYIGTYPDTCASVTTGIGPSPIHQAPLSISVHTSGELFITGLKGPTDGAITAVDGRVIHQGRINAPAAGTPARLALPPLASGLYVFRCQEGTATFFRP